jgi:hypothetical protein
MTGSTVVYFDGDPYVMDDSGEYVELHHVGERS